MNLARLLRNRPAAEHPHRIGHPNARPVADLVPRISQEPTQIIRLPKPRVSRSEITQPLLRFGDPEIVHKILGGRCIDERPPIDDHRPQSCEWCSTEAPAHRLIQPTSIRITGDNAHTECCITPECFHAALRHVHEQDETSDRDIVVEIARRPAVAL